MDTVEIPVLYVATCPTCGYPNDIFITEAELKRTGGAVGTIKCARGEKRFGTDKDSRGSVCGQTFAAFVE